MSQFCKIENREEADSLAQGHPATSRKPGPEIPPSSCHRALCTNQTTQSAFQQGWWGGGGDHGDGYKSPESMLHGSKKKKRVLSGYLYKRLKVGNCY